MRQLFLTHKPSAPVIRYNQRESVATSETQTVLHFHENIYIERNVTRDCMSSTSQMLSFSLSDHYSIGAHQVETQSSEQEKKPSVSSSKTISSALRVTTHGFACHQLHRCYHSLSYHYRIGAHQVETQSSEQEKKSSVNSSRTINSALENRYQREE